VLIAELETQLALVAAFYLPPAASEVVWRAADAHPAGLFREQTETSRLRQTYATIWPSINAPPRTLSAQPALCEDAGGSGPVGEPRHQVDATASQRESSALDDGLVAARRRFRCEDLLASDLALLGNAFNS
jgi:hypothetical protein